MLANIVRKEITEPLSIEMLQRLVPSWCRVSFYDKLAKYKSLKDALQGKKCMVVLYNVHKDSPKRTVENKAGQPSFNAMRRRAAEHPIEEGGEKLRGMMPWIAADKIVDKSRN